ncbi:transporter substrate-binding domain-containing protein [Endozoicomonas sp. G2_1]|uniref:substrate-binding periplasmic protein n=1 Tax=Endozoicomonas sp. G2_1 TaxID=2821091 RepID=UPI001AD9BF89|nr:transporter substrate-binding domain-containing protein [Endozoicomonas sp. G2_1]MBO9490801.1 transporter substrate-binding domain-containing protein [Endozoicomonas sp. G2_1]
MAKIALLFQFIGFIAVNALLPISVAFANDKELLLLTDDGPPHMIAANESGIDLDITKQVLQSLGYRVNVEFSPLQRNLARVTMKQADLFVPTFYQPDTDKLFLSEPIISYRPTIFSLKSRDFDFEQLADIKNLTIYTFQGATGYFGEQFSQMSEQNNYREFHDMSKLPELLLKQRVDLIVLDYYIFYYFLNQLPITKKIANQAHKIDEHTLIPPVTAHVGFNNPALRNNFNRVLAQYLAAGKDKKVIEKYIGITPSH